MNVPWRTEFTWMTVEVRAFIDLLCLGQKHHLPHSRLLLLNYRLLGMVSHTPRRTSHKINRIICFLVFFFLMKGHQQGLAHFAASLVFILDLLEHDKRGEILC